MLSGSSNPAINADQRDRLIAWSSWMNMFAWKCVRPIRAVPDGAALVAPPFGSLRLAILSLGVLVASGITVDAQFDATSPELFRSDRDHDQRFEVDERPSLSPGMKPEAADALRKPDVDPANSRSSSGNRFSPFENVSRQRTEVPQFQGASRLPQFSSELQQFQPDGPTPLEVTFRELRGHTELIKSSVPGGPETFRNQQLNYELTVPGSTWTNSPHLLSLNPIASLALNHRTSRLLILVIVEPVGIDGRVKPEHLVDASEAEIRRTSSSVEVIEPVSLTVGGVSGLRFSARSVMQTPGGDSILHRVNWAGCHNGWCIQITTIAPPEALSELKDVWKYLPNNFRLIDPNRLSPPHPLVHFKHSAPEIGAEVDLSGTGFLIINEQSTSPDSPALRAATASQEGLFLYHCRLPERATSRLTALEVMLYRLGVTLQTARASLTTVPHDTLHAFDYVETAAESELRLDRHIRVLLSDDAVWAIALLDNPQATPAQRAKKWAAAVSGYTFNNPVGTVIDLPQVQKLRQSDFWFEFARHYQRHGKTERAKRCLQLCHSLLPDNIDVRCALINFMVEQEMYEEAVPLFENLPPLMAIDSDRTIQHATVLGRAGQIDRAIEIFATIEESGRLTEDSAQKYAEILELNGRTEEAIRVFTDILMTTNSPVMAFKRSQLLVATERADEAVEDLRRRREASPLRFRDYTLFLTETLIDANRSEEALRELELARENDGFDVHCEFLKGRALLAGGNYVRARESFEAVLKYAPDLLIAQEYVDAIASRLGQGDVADVLTVIKPVVLPETIHPATKAPASLRPEDDYWTAMDARSIRFRAGKEYRLTRRTVAHILTREGVEAFSRLQFTFDASTEQLHVNRVQVFDETGRSVAETEIRDCFVLAAEEDGLVTNQKVMNVPVSGLKPGCRLEYEVTWNDQIPPERFPGLRYSTLSFGADSDVVVSIEGDVSQVRWSGPSPSQNNELLLWEVQRQRIDSVAQLDDLTPLPGTICLGDQSVNWDAIGRDYFKDIEDRLTPSDAVTPIVADLLRDSATEPVSRRVDRLVEWVRNELTYQGIEFGWRGRLMPPVEQTLQKRYGDCKDHSLLLWQLLQAAGIKSQLTLVNTDSAVVEEVPSASQFNHMIVYTEDELGGRFIDPTERYVPNSARIPNGLALKVALIIDGDRPHLKRIPDYSPESNRMWIDRAVVLDRDGAAEVTEKMWFTGQRASYLRSVFANVARDGQKAVVKSLLPQGGDVSMTDYQLQNLQDASKHLIVDARYRVPDYLDAIAGQLAGRIELVGSFGGPAEVEEAERTLPFRIYSPSDTSVRVRVTPPPGFRTTIADGPENLSSQILAGVRSVSADSEVVEIRARLRRRSGRFRPESWNDWRQANLDATRLLKPQIVLSPVGTNTVSGPVRPASAIVEP